jgi:hypothetical protein
VKIEMIKHAGGTLTPANDTEADKFKRFPNGEQFAIEIKLPRNPAFHGKVFAFFNFCFQYWKSGHPMQDESKQFDVFRNHMTVLAGYHNKYYNIDGGVRVEAQSLSFGSMSEEEFSSLYHALIQVAMTKIFPETDENTRNQLYSFF